MTPFRTAIIGCGGIANRHATTITQLTDDLRLVACCDAIQERAAGFSQKYANGDARVYLDYRRMFEEVPLDLIFICLPPFAHADEVDLAAAHGVHLLIEKPIALDIDLANRMLRAVETAGVKSQVGFMFRFGEAVETVAEMLQSGAAGPPGLFIGRYLCNSLHSPWWRDRAKSGGQIVEQIIHTFDLARYLLGEPATVFSRMRNQFHQDVDGYTAEDVSGTVVTFANGAIATISATNGAIPGQWISQAELVTDHLTVSFTDSNNATLHHTNLSWPRTTTIASQKDLFLAETRDLLTAIRTGGRTRTPISEGARSLQLVLAARESAETGQVVTVR